MSNKPLHFYREEDINIITNNLDKLEEKANKIILEKYEPTIDERNSVVSIIKQYIRDNNLIVYGGYAQNALIKEKRIEDAFYGEYDKYDIEFYSTKPINDLINLCDILHKKNFKYVEGSEGVHSGTYKLFVNFENYADCSHMPENIFNNIPTINVDGIRMSHPHFMFVDALRNYVDMFSYFRLSKAFSRFTKLIYHYPFNLNNMFNKIVYDENITDNKEMYNRILNFAVDLKLVVVGHKAFNRLLKKSKMKELYLVQEPYFELISHNFINDRDKIYNSLKNKYGNDIKYVKFNPFLHFFDKSVIFYYKNQMILKLYGRNERCLVYDYSEKSKLYYGSYNLQLIYLFGNYFLGYIKQNNFIKTSYMTMITRLIYAKNKYLDENKMNSLSKSPFEEFTLDCLGEPINDLRESKLRRAKNIKEKKRVVYRYKPTGTPGNPPNFKFSNLTGDPYK